MILSKITTLCRGRKEDTKERRTKVPEVHRNACVVKQLSRCCVTRFILLQFEQGSSKQRKDQETI